MAINYDAHQHEDVARIFRALAEPSRLTLIHCLADGPHRVGELSTHLGLAQSTVSAHLALLREAGLVSATPEGRATVYRLAHSGLDDLLHAGERLLVTPDSPGAPGAPDSCGTYEAGSTPGHRHHDASQLLNDTDPALVSPANGVINDAPSAAGARR